MFKLIGAVLVLLVVGGVADAAARSSAEAQVEATVAAQVAGAAGVSASIESFPFLPRLLGSGRAGDVTLRVERVAGAGVTLADVRIAATDVVLDRDALLPGFDVEVRDIDEARVSALIGEGELSRLLGVPLEVSPGSLAVTVRGQQVTADARVEGDELVLDLGRLPALRVPVPRSPLVPCTGTVRLVDGAVELSCTVQDVPPALVRVASGR